MRYSPSWPLEWDMNGTVCQTKRKSSRSASEPFGLRFDNGMSFRSASEPFGLRFDNGMSFNAEPESHGNNATHANP